MDENPLLQVPPAGRGNRTRARFPSRSGGNLKEGGVIINSALAIGKCLRDMISTREGADTGVCPYRDAVV